LLARLLASSKRDKKHGKMQSVVYLSDRSTFSKYLLKSHS